MSRKSKTIRVAIGVVFSLALGASTVRADAVDAKEFFEKLSWDQQIELDLSDLNQEAVAYLQNEHSNSGKHVGFSGSSVRHSPTLGVVGYNSPIAATPNPEPATMVLFGTGLFVLGAYARRKYHG
jgi:hypothetical protein